MTNGDCEISRIEPKAKAFIYYARHQKVTCRGVSQERQKVP